MFTRRKFLSGLAATTAAFRSMVTTASTQTPKSSKNLQPPPEKIGIALGAGGAKGLAHILMLEALDEMGIRPHMMAGSSMGAVIGVLYASGLSGKEIRQFIGRLVVTGDESWPEALFSKDLVKWIDFIEPELGSGGLIDGENFIRYLHTAIGGSVFSELSIPFKVVAADFWRREQVVIESGSLLPALKASMAIPGLFAPVTMNDRVLVDGGTVNPVPYDLLLDDCDITIAVDVTGSAPVDNHTLPSFFDAIFSSVHIMQKTILAEKMKQHRPDIYIKPAITGVRMLDFFNADLVYRQATPAKVQLKEELAKILS